MKKPFIYLTFILAITQCSAQEFYFGPIAGYNFYDIEIDGSISAGGGSGGLNIGLFSEYSINNQFGLKFYGLYNRITEGEYFIPELSFQTFFEEIKITSLQFLLLTKFDVNKEYKKGFYLTAGLRHTNNLSREALTDENLLNDFFKDSYFGVLGGFGVDFSKHFSIELLIDRNISNTLNDNDNIANNYGAFINLLFDVNYLFKN